jgi:hypothetical protein
VNVTAFPAAAAPPTAASIQAAGPATDGVGGFAALLSGALAEPRGEGPGTRRTAADDVSVAPEAERDEASETVAAAAAVLPADVNRVNRALDGLHPEFRDRLGRVIERMEGEFGHRVRVVETLRTQERQDFLYAQGRTRPGPVVTWTRNSNHLAGRAADVLIDGTYNNPAGYARLAKIAQEEGLRTLGPRDPGHVELPRSFGDVDRSTPNVVPRIPGELPMHLERIEAPARPPQSGGGLARVADVAAVARVAEVARVAQVARVAEPGVARRGTAEAELVHGETRLQGIRAASETRQEDSGGSGQGGGERGEWMPALAGRSVAGGGAAPQAQGVFGVDVAARVARVLELQEGASARPLSSILLRLDNPAGGEDRIRVDLRGTSVDARLDLNDPAEAQRLGARIGDLRQALERQGLEADALRIRATGVARPDAAEAVRAAAAIADEPQRPTHRTGADAQGQPGRGRTPDQMHDDAGSRRSRQETQPETEDPT